MNTQSPLPSQTYRLFVVLSLIGFSLLVCAVNRLFQRFPLESWEDPILTWTLLGMSAFCWGRLISLGYRYLRQERQAGTALANLGDPELFSLIVVCIMFTCAIGLVFDLFFAKISKTMLEADIASRIMGFTAAWIFFCCAIYGRFSHKWITNQGILASGLLIKWQVIESFQWIGHDQNTLCLTLRKAKTPGLLWGQVQVKHQIPAEHKESVDRILNQYLTPGLTQASTSNNQNQGRQVSGDLKN